MCCMNLDIASIRFTLATFYFITSILLKNSSCHLSSPTLFWSESGCKDKAFLSFLPNLFRSFFKLFFRGSRLRDFPSSKIVVNMPRTPPTRQVFHPFYRPSPSGLAGAKIKDLNTLLQIFLPLFWKFFSSSWKTRFYGRHPGARRARKRVN